MVFRQINSDLSLKKLREKNYMRMKHFIYISNPRYLKDNPISKADFQTYEYEKFGQHKKDQKVFRTNVVGDFKLVKSEVDNMLNFTSNVPNEWQKKWEKSLNVKADKLTSKP